MEAPNYDVENPHPIKERFHLGWASHELFLNNWHNFILAMFKVKI
jgi:hypothetical protein